LPRGGRKCGVRIADSGIASHEDLAPAIKYAEEGFPVSELIAYYWGRNVAILAKQPGAILQTYTIGGKPPAKGEIFRNPDLAHYLSFAGGTGT
jgi:gamma-glutamyltranspeptidase